MTVGEMIEAEAKFPFGEGNAHSNGWECGEAIFECIQTIEIEPDFAKV